MIVNIFQYYWLINNQLYELFLDEYIYGFIVDFNQNDHTISSYWEL